jgi:hypothetical protein
MLKRIIFTNFIYISILTSIYAQDVLYLADGTKQLCKITSIDQTKVSFKSVDNFEGPTYTKENNLFLLAFKDNGKYLILDNRVVGQINNTNDFLSTAAERPHDILITNENNVISGQIVSTEGDQYKYKRADNNDGPDYIIKKSNLAAVIYRNGKHQLFVSPLEASKRLALTKEKVDELISASLIKNADSSNVDASYKEGEKINITNSNIKKDKLTLSDEDLKQFQIKAQQKVNSLGEYISIIADKSTSLIEGNKAIDLAEGLFLDKTSRIEVSNLNIENNVKYEVRKYLNRLRALKYDEVVVTWIEVSYVSNLEKGPDGNYHGVVTFQQIFEGYSDGIVTYQDVTQKNVEVVLKSYSKQKRGEIIELWDVFLTNVKVEETR